ncbi:MAG: DUF547 domain-containing protein [Oscillatoria sp. SIO1A7]|nr:DUF547 domain-containing protein [Oscillatoria sp. SIO1A7]
MNKMKKAIVLLLPVLFMVNGCGAIAAFEQDATPAQQSAQVSQNEPFSYEPYARVLATYVDAEGKVDYKALGANRGDLDKFNNSLATLPRSTYDSWTEEEQIALWVNAYNSLTLKAIVDNNPKKSIRDIFRVWDRLKFNVMGEEMSLNHLEHKILRKDFNEPRIHMGIVCASIGCPLLRREPFVGDRLAEQLDEQTREFLALDRNFKLDRQDKRVHLSSIFKWFGEDFEITYGAKDKFTGKDKERAVLNFVSGYLSESDRNYLMEGKYKIDYLSYDWSLNAQ